MAGFNYARTRATAERLIKRAGRSAVLVKPGAETGEPWDPEPGAPTRHDAIVVVTEYSIGERRNTEIQMSDRRILMSTEGLEVAPANSDSIELGGETYAIINAMPLEPADVVLLWDIQARR